MLNYQRVYEIIFKKNKLPDENAACLPSIDVRISNPTSYQPLMACPALFFASSGAMVGEGLSQVSLPKSLTISDPSFGSLGIPAQR